jgi:hypothetical protein
MTASRRRSGRRTTRRSTRRSPTSIPRRASSAGAKAGGSASPAPGSSPRGSVTAPAGGRPAAAHPCRRRKHGRGPRVRVSAIGNYAPTGDRERASARIGAARGNVEAAGLRRRRGRFIPVDPSRAHNPKVAGSNPAPATKSRVKAQVVDLGLRRWRGVLPGSGGLHPLVLPAFHRLGGGRWNGRGGLLIGTGGVGLHSGCEVLVGLDD